MSGIKQIPAGRRRFGVTRGQFGAAARNAVERRPHTTPSGTVSAGPIEECRCSVAADKNGYLYNEEAFQFLLALERERYARSKQPFALALVGHGVGGGSSIPMESSVGPKVLAGLVRTLRDTDVVGWYREGRVVGVIFTHLGDGPRADAYRLVKTRTVETLRACLPQSIAQRLDVHLYGPLEFPEA